MNRTFKPNRQGITLLFVVSMIVLFLLLGTAFVVVANNFNRESTRRIRSNQPEGKGELQGNALVEDVMFQIIRGTDLRDVDSPLRTHDLLADQYGYGVRAFVSRNTTVTPAFIGGEAFIQFTLTSDRNDNPGNDPVDAADNSGFSLLTRDQTTLEPTLEPLSPDRLNGTFGGRVLSFITGPAKGFSARIAADAFNSDGFLRFRIPTTSVNGDIITATDLANLAGSEVIINGRDFSGLVVGNDELLNRVGRTHTELTTTTGVGFSARRGFLVDNNVNETWDAADLANPFLAGFDKAGNPIPSYYRQALIDRNATPNRFTVGRPFFHAFDVFDVAGDGTPDVDTTNSGTPDSFWMDLGMSIVTNSNGQRFKPLAAVHIRDLDGLLNVNAHGNITHTRADGFVATAQNFAGAQPNTPRGPGMGPPEINILDALGGDTTKLQAILAGRYGPDGLPGNGVNSFRSRAKLFGHPTDPVDPDANQFGTTGGLYSSAMDIHGRFRIGTPASSNSTFHDFRDPNFRDFKNSLPQIDMTSTLSINAFNDEFTGNPYEMSLSGDATGDTPFTVEELERLLRPDDIDSLALPSRLSSIVDVNTGLFTTLSFDVPTLYRSFAEEITSNLERQGVADPTTRVDIANTLLGQLAFAPELSTGLKMDINRPFGDGLDNNTLDGNGAPVLDSDGNLVEEVVDEPDEAAQQANIAAEVIFGSTNETVMDLSFQSTRDSPAARQDTNPRVIYARNLYMLAMLLLDPISLGSGAVDPADQLAFARSMAQWSVNVVDFRDADSIHTRFVYDPNPFDTNGWNPVFDDIDATTGEVLTPAPFAVWGCERPELLITETLAVHLQNFQNLERDPNKTPDYQQRLRPEPFAYFEVYNPWTQNRLTQRPPAELYDSNGTGVDLGKLAPDGSPIWRFEVARLMQAGDATQGFKPLRYVYMADPTQSNITYSDSDKSKNQVPGDIAIFFGDTTVNVRPGSHALIGTQGFEDPDTANTFEVFMGRKENAMDPNNIGFEATNPTRDELLLNETTRLALNADTGTVTRYTNSDVPESPRRASIVFIDQASVVSPTGVADMPGPRKFSLSDPRDGYPEPDTLIPDGGIYTTPSSNPLDRIDGAHINTEDLDAILARSGGLTPNFRYIRLQRLANPLIDWDKTTNPYLTIDTMEADLISFNGSDGNVAVFSDPGGRQPQALSQERFGDQQTSNGSLSTNGTNINNIWRHQREEGTFRPASGSASTDHFFDLIFNESLGQTNDTYRANATDFFPWLTWNNRPFVSHMEIMNVPYLAPDRLTYAPQFNLNGSTTDPTAIPVTFSIDDNVLANQYNGRRLFAGKLSGRYGHLINFFGSHPTDNNHSHAYRLLDFLEVPSRFVGNESWYLANGETGVLQHPFNTISHYRVPGKINLNTIPPTSPGANASVVWDALAGEYRQSLTWENYKESLYGSRPTTNATDFTEPFRPAAAAESVLGRFGDPPFPIQATLLRPRLLNGNPNPTITNLPNQPLFDYESNNVSDNTDRSFTFRNGFRNRLANMTTTKSSVFAGWITIGFFEVDQDENLVDTTGMPLDTDGNPRTPATLAPGVVPAEIGAESGEQVRHRGFFIFDRSLPVAYEPGKNHNVDKAILLKTIIE